MNPTVCLLLCLTLGADTEQDRRRRLEFMKQSVRRVEIEIQSDEKARLKLHPEPIQRWNNPVTGIHDGTLFIWLDHGRPMVAAQVFPIPDGRWLQEFQSLTTNSLRAVQQGKQFWLPTESGVTWRDPPRAQNPAKSAPLRLVQMRSIARQFSVTDVFTGTEPSRLRLLTKPLYRYGDAGGEVLDGAVFSFAIGTDPEVLMLVEAQRSGTGAVWKIAFAPMTSYACSVKAGDKEFWSCPSRPSPNPPGSTFMTYPFKALDD